MSKRVKDNKCLSSCWLYRTECGRLTTALVTSLGILIIVLLFIHPVFMTIDDARLKYVYAGYSTGEPVSTYLFCYYPLSLILSTLYRILPGIPWYALYQFGVIGLGSALIGKTIYRIAYRKKIPFFMAIVLHIGLYLSLALISTIIMHFEITAAVIATAGIVVLLGMDLKNDPLCLKITDGIVSAFCIALSFVIQFNAFYAICCYLLVAAVVVIADAFKDESIRKVVPQLLCYLLILAVFIGAVKISDNLSKNTPEWQQYMQYNKYRVSFWDYSHIDYHDNPELFERMGWSEEFYNLTQSMYFMDARFTGENLSQFTERFSWFKLESFDVLVATAQETLQGLFKAERVAVLQTVVIFLFGFVIILLCCSKRRWKEHYPQLLGLLCCFGGTLLLALFLAARGRLPLRAWMAFSMPSIATMLVLMLQICSTENVRMAVAVRRSFMAGCLCVIWILGMRWTYEKVIKMDWQWRADCNTNTLMMEQYVASHPENVYVYDHLGAQNYSVFSQYPSNEFRPSNAFVWGSSYLFTPAYQEQLNNNGIDQLLTENLFDDNVYFITSSNGAYMDMLKGMLAKDYGTFTAEPVDYIGETFTVYKFANK